jgi:TRAP transporter TAXI family solute receptor
MIAMRVPHWRDGGRMLACAALLCAAAGVGACERAADSADRRFMSLGTAGTGGLYYPLGGALASRLSARDTARQYTAEVTGGSVENITRIASGEMDLGLAIGTSVHEAYTGGRDFPQAIADLRVIAPLYPNLTHVLVPTGSAVHSIRGLRGARVSVGAAGSGTEQVAQHVLAAYGLSYDDVDEQYLSFTESAAALADGAIDAAILSVGYPASAVLEVTTTGRARLLPIDSTAIDRLVDAYSYYSPAVIPAGAYPGMAAPVATVSVMNWVIAREDLPAEVVVLLLDILRDDAEALRAVVDIAGQINIANMYASPIPLHEAARAWLEEAVPRGG